MIVPCFALGDVIDDYCPRCKLLLNHAVASMMGSTVVKVVCQTCHSEHPFKNAEVPPKKKSGPSAALLDQVLAKVAPASPEPEPEEKAPEPEAAAEPAKKEIRSGRLPAIFPGTPSGLREASVERSDAIHRRFASVTRTFSRETSSYSVPRHSIRRVNPATTKFPSMIQGTSGDSCQ